MSNKDVVTLLLSTDALGWHSRSDLLEDLDGTKEVIANKQGALDCLLIACAYPHLKTESNAGYASTRALALSEWPVVVRSPCAGTAQTPRYG